LCLTGYIMFSTRRFKTFRNDTFVKHPVLLTQMRAHVIIGSTVDRNSKIGLLLVLMHK
jgi:hypothetical protein